MIRSFFHSTAIGLAAALFASVTAAPAQAPERPADRLSRYLHELAADPTSLSALIGAGQAALEVGDGNAALGFFARADEHSPRNGQIKAGLARALLMVDNPREALKMFDAARSLGVPEVEIAGDRGLAYDLRGDTRKAQHDYALALSRGPNDEITKRYALSLGISGEREQALKLIDPLLYKRDQGAWRARAFVLAMTGDLPGASRIVHKVMPERMAETMDPFLAKLAALNSAQKAAAVHLGEMPANLRVASAEPIPQPTAPPTFYPPTATATPAAQTQLRSQRRASKASKLLASPPPEKVVRVAPAPSPTPAPAQVAQTKVAERGNLDAIMHDLRSAAAEDAPARVAQAAPKPTPTPRVAAKKEDPAKAKAADTDEDCKPAPRKTKGKVAKTKCEPVGKTTKQAAAKKKAEPKNPARIWVQVAGGANEDALPKEWTRVTAKEASIKGKGPWTAKNRATNRLLAGPYKTDDEAQAVVRKLRKAGIGAFQWHSDAGEAVEKIGGK
ncbi:MAG TPA: SPOR domain-containing protein [Sphingomonas sp.]|nr:SPOR domain-containing protein [Sphingomonas sp.]